MKVPISLIAVCCAWGVSATASNAAEIVQTFQVSAKNGSPTGSFYLAPFNPALGKLIDVKQYIDVSHSFTERFRTDTSHPFYALTSQSQTDIGLLDATGTLVSNFVGFATYRSGYYFYPAVADRHVTATEGGISLPWEFFVDGPPMPYRFVVTKFDWSGQAYADPIDGTGDPQMPPYTYEATPEDLTVSARIVYEYAAVPEPASWAMLIVGAATAGGALRRRTFRARRPAIA